MKQAKVLSKAELRRVMAVAEASKHPERNTLVLMLSYQAGLRACEIAALRVSDVVDEAGKPIQQVYLAAEQTKGNQTQVVYFSKRLQQAVAAYVRAQGLKRSEALIGSQKGGKFTSATVQQLFRVLYRQAGIANASSHSGRRTMITSLSSQGVSVRVIQALARHANLATTARYIDVSADKLANAVELV